MRLALAALLLAATAAGLFVGRKRLGLPSSVGLGWAAFVAFVLFGFDPPTPRSVAALYVAVATIAAVMYVTSSEEAVRAVGEPLRELLASPARRAHRAALGVLLPLAVAGVVHRALLPSADPPPQARSAHPAPPGTLELRARGAPPRSLDVLRAENPYRDADPARRADAVARGRVVYFESCVLCHGAGLDGDGLFADALAPPPADFTDVGVLPMFVDGFFFWRIATGGPGLPAEGAPWDSAMPAWQAMLDEDELWSVLTFLSDETGLSPRRREVYPGNEEAP